MNSLKKNTNNHLRNVLVRRMYGGTGTLYLYGEILFICIFCFLLSLVPISCDIRTHVTLLLLYIGSYKSNSVTCVCVGVSVCLYVCIYVCMYVCMYVTTYT